MPGLQREIEKLQFTASKAEWGAKVAGKEKEEGEQRVRGLIDSLRMEIAGLEAQVERLEAEKADEERERRLRAALERAAAL